jgi:hypothetical protein
MRNPKCSGPSWWCRLVPAGAVAPRLCAWLVLFALLAPAAVSEAFISGGQPWPKRMRGTLVYTGDANWVNEDNSVELVEGYTVEFDVIYRLLSVQRLTRRKTAASYAIEYLGYEVTRGTLNIVDWNFDLGCYAEVNAVHIGAGSSVDQTLGGGTMTPRMVVGGKTIPRTSFWFAVTPPGEMKIHYVEYDQCADKVGEFDRVWGAFWSRQGGYRVRDTVLKVVMDSNWSEPWPPVPGIPTYFHTLTGTLRGVCRGVCP